jgi:hypothetical protein
VRPRWLGAGPKMAACGAYDDGVTSQKQILGHEGEKVAYEGAGRVDEPKAKPST